MSERNDLVSIVIPAYNTEAYIEEMLRCTVNQSYRNLQIIVVDDGSKDDTALIVKRFTELDARIEYIYQENQGVSAARNNGLLRVRGQKVFFFDSDDTFESNLVEACVDYSEEHNVQTVLYGHADNIDGCIQNRHVFSLRGNYFGEEVVTQVMPRFMGFSFDDINDWIKGKRSLREGKEHTALWRMMFDAKTLENTGLLFDTNLSLGEDTRFINEYLLITKSVGVLDCCLYYLRIRQGSANVTSIGNPKLMMENKIKLITARTAIDKESEKHGHKTDVFWKGTVILSAVQLALRLSNNVGSRRENWSIYTWYMSNETVKRCVKEFVPAIGLKMVPFILLKLRLSKILFVLCGILPSKITNRFI